MPVCSVEHGWGGDYAAELVDEMIGDLKANFMERWPKVGEKRRVYKDEIEEFFTAEFDEQFEVVAEDGSIQEVSVMLVQLYHECSLGEYANSLEKIAKFEAKKAYLREKGKTDARVLAKEVVETVVVECGGCDDAACCEPLEEDPPLVDADGWTTVVTKKKKNKRR